MIKDVDDTGVPKGLPIRSFEDWAVKLIALLPDKLPAASAGGTPVLLPAPAGLQPNEFSTKLTDLDRLEASSLKEALANLAARCAQQEPPLECTVTETELLGIIVEQEGVCEPSGLPIVLAKGMPHATGFTWKATGKVVDRSNVRAEVGLLTKMLELHQVKVVNDAEVIAVQRFLHDCFLEY